ncbi:MAG TPA: DUF2157 domain-containing protein [Candidatus Polarisedimenticolaceae bacterium]|nr:DUF2157 domain-containing protein [Candidatus Polarisedimenticolaceae bacterium]
MSRASVAWLRGELPKLVAAGVLTPEAAEALRRHYGAEDSGVGKRLALALLSVLGALLVGGGIILLFAHNWDQLSRGARASLLIALLLSTQALAAFALLRRFMSVVLREVAGALQVAAVATAIALVAQTYQVPGDLVGYYRTVLLLALPLIYLLESATASVLCWAALVAMATTWSWRGDPEVLAWWGLAAAGVPFLVFLARREADAWRTALTIVLGVVALFIGGTINAVRSSWDGLWMLYGLALLAVVHALGSRESAEAWRRRLRAPAYVGLVVLGLMLTFEWPWRGVENLPETVDGGVWATAAVAIALGAWATWHAVHLFRLREIHLAVTSAAWVVGALAYVLALAYLEPGARLLVDLWLAAVGITGLAEGWQSGRLVRANAGLLALASLAVARFFDADVSFVVRGLAFIAVGVGFLVANLFLVRRGRRQVEVTP